AACLRGGRSHSHPSPGPPHRGDRSQAVLDVGRGGDHDRRHETAASAGSLAPELSLAMNFIGLDIGTSAVKAVLAGDDQQILASSSAPLVTRTPHPSWREQHPQDWWDATRAVLA